MKTSYKIPIIVIPTILILSFFVISYDNALDDTPYDVEIIFDEEEYSVSYFIVNGNTGNIEIDIPLDMVDGVFMIYVNDQVVDDERVTIDGNKVIINYGQNIESVKLMGSHDLSEIEPVHFTIEELLTENQIDYLPDTLVVTSGPTIRGDPGCGAVIDTDSQTHWFGINSISKPQEITLFLENPHMCKVNTGSCFCNAQREFTALTLDELYYFTLQEEEKYAEILIDYLDKENINRTPKFQIGKFNLIYTDSSAIGYCGELWGTNTYDFFEGAFVKDLVKDYSISKEISPLCAIRDDTQYFGKMFGEE